MLLITATSAVYAQFQSIFGACKSLIRKQPQPYCLARRCEVPFSHKGKVFVMALLSVPDPDSKLCALLLFFPLEQTNHAHPHHLLAEPSWELKPHWLGGTPRRLWEVLLCLHASRENPNNNCYLGQPDNVQLSRQTHRDVSMKYTRTHGS